jgi:TonB family protein
MQREKKDKHFISKPIYEGGPKALREFVRKNLQYPPEALKNKVEGTVVLNYTIDHTGEVTDAKVISGPGHGCEEEAVRLVKLLKFHVPRNRGVKVQFHKDIHIHFRMPKAKKAEAFSAVVYNIVPSGGAPAKPKPGEQEKENKGKSYDVTIKW